jgi:hypothetical protein
MADEKQIKVRIKRDYWDADGKRVAAGTEVEVPISAALSGVEAGILETVKDDKPKKA